MASTNHEILNKIDDIKQKLTDAEYKDIVDLLKIKNENGKKFYKVEFTKQEIKDTYEKASCHNQCDDEDGCCFRNVNCGCASEHNYYEKGIPELKQDFKSEILQLDKCEVKRIKNKIKNVIADREGAWECTYRIYSKITEL
jgi:hypothetical protein